MVLGVDGSFDDYAKKLAADCTERFNEKLSMALTGSKSDNMRSQCIEFIAYLWKQRDPPGNIGNWKSVRRHVIETDLGYCRCGGPKKKIVFVNVLSNVLRRMERFGLIEREATNERTVSYKISISTLAEILTRDEQTRRLNQRFWKQDINLNILNERLIAIEWYLKNKCNMDCSPDIIDQWVDVWREQRGGQDRTSSIEYIGVVPPLTKK